MKTRNRYALLGLIAGSALMWGGSVTIPNTFTANTTAKASEVNANFSAVKTAVDGNDNDIATNKSDITINTNNIASMVKNITAGDGIDVANSSGAVTIGLKDGYVMVHGSAFNSISDDGSGCILVRWWLGTSVVGTYFSGVSTGDDCATRLAPKFRSSHMRPVASVMVP